MTVLDENNSNNIKPEPHLTKDQILSLYKLVVEMMNEHIEELKETINQHNETMKIVREHYVARLIEIHAEHEETKENLKQLIKKDEMKTALIKQMMKK
jgi:hypothetical protein